MNINEKYNDNLVESNKYTKQSRQYCVDIRQLTTWDNKIFNIKTL